jgi:hypothetical protein
MGIVNEQNDGVRAGGFTKACRATPYTELSSLAALLGETVDASQATSQRARAAQAKVCLALICIGFFARKSLHNVWRNLQTFSSDLLAIEPSSWRASPCLQETGFLDLVLLFLCPLQAPWG